MALQGGKQASHLEAEGDRNRLLQVGARGHWRRAVLPRELFRGCNRAAACLLNTVEGRLDLQDGGGVRNVLGCRPPVAVLAGVPPAQMGNLVDKAEHWV